uniref:BRO-N domain-containing protein n=1 Tax=Pseudomonas sp. G166 TaxID=3094846 RepID=UPI00403FB61B
MSTSLNLTKRNCRLQTGKISSRTGLYGRRAGRTDRPPEYDLLFVATRVARAAGLKNPSHAVGQFHAIKRGVKVQVREVEVSLSKLERDGRLIPINSWLFDESRVYALLLRGKAPASETFRKWVTEEVLPTIRKTGRYDADQSANPIAQSVMGELKML